MEPGDHHQHHGMSQQFSEQLMAPPPHPSRLLSLPRSGSLISGAFFVSKKKTKQLPNTLKLVISCNPAHLHVGFPGMTCRRTLFEQKENFHAPPDSRHLRHRPTRRYPQNKQAGVAAKLPSMLEPSTEANHLNNIHHEGGKRSR